MRATHLAFLVIGCALFIQGRAFAAPRRASGPQVSVATSSNAAGDHGGDVEQAARARDGKQQAKGKSADVQREPADSANQNRTGGHANPTKTNLARQASKSVGRSTNKSGANYDQPFSANPGRAAVGKWMQNEGARPAFPGRTSRAAGSSTSSLPSVRHRSPNPPIAGGSAGASTKNAGAINGTGMNHKR
jgi:hypothetical protein